MSRKFTYSSISLIFLSILAVRPLPVAAQTVISFEGLSNLQPIGTISGATFSANWLSINSCTVGGPGNFVNPPSGTGIAFILVGGPGTVGTITFAQPVANVSIRYADRTSSLTLTAYDQPGNVVGVAVGQQTTLTSTGQCGVIDAWGTLRINSPTGPIASVTMHDSGNFFAIDDFTFSAGFQIIRPSDNDTFPLTQSSFTQTLPITFEAEPIAPGAAVQWTAQLNYATSGGRGHFQEVRNFATDPTNTTQNETYTSTGGKVTVQATETSTTTQTAQPISVYVVGTAIPDTDITARLVSLYGGATPNLMTGIAKRESSYTQFVTRSLFGISALWPTESPDGGSHIGLMQMPVSKADAWDWQANTSDGVTLFSASKLPAATRLANRIIASHPGLRQLNSVELEHMALVLYGPAASANLSAQYYAPVPSASGWDWAVNTTGNPNGIAYANYIFSNVR